ncbi:MAG: PEGA domain-containing protein [Trueperaceae bacterium]|jgi:hypothetical protein|nr:PEGA domain-containing protein [Truepera sp.]HRN18557.1 PEGA domain-containing protein [Trueperaceae bacterium]HRQ10612.1 PEGA domain-containing protein [Trueperaceae bacterium]
MRHRFLRARFGWAGLVLLLVSLAQAQVSVPTFGTRGGVSDEIVQSFMSAFRSAVGTATGLEVRGGELITPGIAGSLEPEFATLIAELDQARYAVSGEISRVTYGAGDAYGINLIVVDAERDRSSDLISLPLEPSDMQPTVKELAAAVAGFTSARLELLKGDAGVFVSSEPSDAQVFLDGVALGRTSHLDVAMVAPGRYQLEVRKEGFLPDVRMVELRKADTAFVHVVLTAISGGSIQVVVVPRARVLLDGVASGTSPVTLAALPGTHRVTLIREGFHSEVLDVLVRNYRVSRVDRELTPAADPLVFWEERREVLVYVDGVLQPGAFAEGIKPGLRNFELRGAHTSRTYLRAVPEHGAYRLDLETGELAPLVPPASDR